MLWLAWKVANARPADDEPDASARPLTFLQAAAFQWVNPKAWVMAITAMAVYADPVSPYWSVLMIGLVFALTNFPSVSVWAAFGVGLRGFLSDPTRLKWFNIGMGVLLAATLWPMLK
jgi:threonine/homoserine/homoserine lactone efflux protein